MQMYNKDKHPILESFLGESSHQHSIYVRRLVVEYIDRDEAEHDFDADPAYMDKQPVYATQK